MLQSRHNLYTGTLRCGLNQGCPLSTYVFAASFDPAIRELEEHFKVVAYADDVLL